MRNKLTASIGIHIVLADKLPLRIVGKLRVENLTVIFEFKDLSFIVCDL